MKELDSHIGTSYKQKTSNTVKARNDYTDGLKIAEISVFTGREY